MQTNQPEQLPAVATPGQAASFSPRNFAMLMLTSLLTSPGPTWDLLRFLIIGGFAELIRRFLMFVWSKLENQFWITATLEEWDRSYYWMMMWLSKRPEWTRARELSISTQSFGVGDIASLVEGEEDGNDQNKIRFLPSHDRTASLWYRGHYVRLSRSRVTEGMWTKQVLTMRILARDHKIINQLLLDAKGAWTVAKAESIFIYASDTRNEPEWHLVASRPKRPLSSIILDTGIKEKILDDARDFLDSKKWYTERGIPFRRGYLLYGAPGTGKTSIIHSLAGELGLDVYIISLSRSNLDDSVLQQLISDLPEKCIALMEDIDAAFHHSLNRETEKPEGTAAAENKEEGSKITLSGLLNALDGVGAQEGRLLFATTNRYEALDHALRRPGRMDVHVEFKLASQYQAGELFKRFYKPEKASPKKLLGAAVADGGESGKDSGYVTPSEERLVDIELPEDEKPLPSHEKKPYTTELVRLSEEFKAHIPDREISMAALQGYLMMHKGRPGDAIDGVEAWVQKEKARREKEVKSTVES
ncbi:P-loop containing nucleoside triphosphate hydrolase protein [Thelephora terrestris]|uniref:P-loop containing nucleoside triphosphate hydrolase protein n=1 Tax=Thelephora terrestris TaxID=56493 RepID=A0A9P6H4F2_9AGAM|nr:P-loop containing nucleoside triphosphate hydrolase protein [Thelephora terrestris]